MDIREGVAADVEAIRAVATAAWHAAYDDILGPETVTERLADWYDPAAVRGYFAESSVSVFVATDANGAVVGYAFCRLFEADDRLHLTAIYVHPDRWGEGIGSALISRVETVGRDYGAETVDLVVLADNGVGRSFYERRGYELMETSDDTVDEDVTELRYAKSI